MELRLGHRLEIEARCCDTMIQWWMGNLVGIELKNHAPRNVVGRNIITLAQFESKVKNWGEGWAPIAGQIVATLQ